MGAMKRAPASRGPPRGGGGIPGGGGGGGRTGVIPGGDGGAGSGGLPGGAGGRGMGGLPGDGKGYDEASARASRGGETYHGIEGATGGDGDGGLHRRGKGHAAEASGRPARGGVNEKGAGGRKIVDGGAGSGGIPGGSGVGGSHLHDGGKERAEVLGGSNEDRGPFSGFLILCVDIEDETFEGYKQQIEALGGKAGTGFDYRAATHIAVEGEIQPGARAIWECDRKVVTTTSWIGSCFEKGRLLRNPPKDSSENLLPANMTPLATKKSTERSCISEGKVSKHRHGISRSSSIRRKLKFSPSGLYHQLLSCEEDRRQAESLYDYALGFRTYETRTLPGLEESFKLCKMSTKFLLGRCYNLMASLHKQKKSLGGVFSSRNFRIYTDDTVRLDILEAQLVLYSDTEGDKDYSSFVTMIKEEVFHGQPLPMDLVEWLSILSKGVLHCHQNVLSNFIYLMEPFQAFGAFVTMYLQFSSIQTTAGWADLFNALRDYDDWPHPRCYHMLKTLAHTDQNGYMVDYEDDIRGLMRLLWNCSKHRAKREVKSFIHMIMANYPRLLSDLQRALYQGGYLSHLTLKSHQ